MLVLDTHRKSDVSRYELVRGEIRAPRPPDELILNDESDPTRVSYQCVDKGRLPCFRFKRRGRLVLAAVLLQLVLMLPLARTRLEFESVPHHAVASN